jgi:hypothetical protein
MSGEAGKKKSRDTILAMKELQKIKMYAVFVAQT